MEKKLGTFLTILLINLTIFSQNDINKICFDQSTAKKIAADLVKGDSAKAELEKTQKLVFQLNEKLVEKDSIIKYYVKKDTNYITQIQKYTEIKEKQSVLVKDLEKDKEKLINENNNLKTGIKWVSGGFLGTLVSLLTFALIK
jgi:HD-GYP domain-containing protein (c-di-GMP phosphodiesterase class II)